MPFNTIPSLAIDQLALLAERADSQRDGLLLAVALEEDGRLLDLVGARGLLALLARRRPLALADARDGGEPALAVGRLSTMECSNAGSADAEAEAAIEASVGSRLSAGTFLGFSSGHSEAGTK